MENIINYWPLLVILLCCILSTGALAVLVRYSGQQVIHLERMRLSENADIVQSARLERVMQRIEHLLEEHLAEKAEADILLRERVEQLMLTDPKHRRAIAADVAAQLGDEIVEAATVQMRAVKVG